MKTLSRARVRKLLNAAENVRVLVVGDVMLDQFLWGRVSRISPEAPVP
ncbi:MAG: carbohydrate kinase, partial [Limisphaerales bacterium]